MVKVVFVGDRPSRLNTNPDIPFVGARCYPRLMDWIWYLQPTHFVFRNSNTEDELKNVQDLSGGGWKVVALGLVASKRLDRKEVRHFSMDHPSRLNRKLNSKEYVIKRLDECKKYLTTE